MAEQERLRALAHDLKQPLATIQMSAENGLRILGREPPNLGSVKEKFERIQSQVARLREMITALSGEADETEDD